MKCLSFFTVFFLLFDHAFAQNLVENSNFGIDTACPYTGGQISFSSGWIQPTLGTPDYFNICDSGGSLAIPYNMAGYQQSNSNAYAGIYTYCGSAYVAPDYKEYIGTTIAPLEIGATYRVTVVVSLADSAFYATDGIGVYFSLNPVNHLTLSTIPVTPQIDYSFYGILTDKTNWDTLTATFIPDSAYTRLVVGDFKYDSAIHLSVCPYYAPSLGGSDSNSYYYIDSVAVEKIAPPLRLSNINQTNGRLLVYPTPSKDFVNVLIDNAGTFSIYDCYGKAVLIPFRHLICAIFI